MAELDLGLEGGTVVTGAGRRRANVYVAGGRIVEVTAERRPARETVDVGGLLVMPGMVDVHVHLMDPADTSREDFPTGSAAALRAGVTTVVEHTHAAPVRSAKDLAEKAAYLAGRSHTDFALGAHAWPEETRHVAPVWRAGAAFLKAFTCTTHGVPGHDPGHLLELLDVAATAGATCLLHCEDESLTAVAERRLREANRTDGGVIPAWRSRQAEQVAVSAAAILAEAAGAKAVIAHASHPEVVERASGLLVETCPQYLTLLEDEALTEGPFRKFTPPARARSAADLEAMWSALASGAIDYVSSDHAPSSRSQKRAGSIWDVHFGLPGLDTTLPILLDGAAAGRLTYERVVAAYAQTPATTYGLRGKGTLEPGADADLVVVDPDERWTVRDEDVLSKAAWTPYAGRTLRGRAVRTYLGGRLACVAGEVRAKPGWGRFLPGPGRRWPLR